MSRWRDRQDAMDRKRLAHEHALAQARNRERRRWLTVDRRYQYDAAFGLHDRTAFDWAVLADLSITVKGRHLVPMAAFEAAKVLHDTIVPRSVAIEALRLGPGEVRRTLALAELAK